MLQEQGIQNKNDTIINKYEKTCNNKYIQAQNYKMLKLHFMVFTSNINHNNIVKFHFSKALASANLYAVKGVINKSADV